MRVHFIAIGGSVMHNLAIALKLKGYTVTGSDDEIYEPARSQLARHGLLPGETGWNALRISDDIDAIVLGMHAKENNPELLKAKELGLKIYSFPEFLYEQSKNKTRVVVGGSHGKTTITAMVLHVLRTNKIDFDYMVGASLQGFDLSVRLSNSAGLIIMEGDEYPDSTINKVPKFHIYRPEIALISGIAWDHINVFPTMESYEQQFRSFVELIPQGGTCIYNAEDKKVVRILEAAKSNIRKIPYATPEYEMVDGKTFLIRDGRKFPLKIFGRHNLQNAIGATEICKALGINEQLCLEALGDFSGAARRLELLAENIHAVVFKDFAHAPSKVRATINAMKEQFPGFKLVACLELHTYSSLNKSFLKEYEGVMDHADQKILFYDSHSFEIKKLEPFSPNLINDFFKDGTIKVFTDQNELKEFLQNQNWKNKALLMMSSGNFGGLDLKELSTFVINHS